MSAVSQTLRARSSSDTAPVISPLRSSRRPVAEHTAVLPLSDRVPGLPSAQLPCNPPSCYLLPPLVGAVLDPVASDRFQVAWPVDVPSFQFTWLWPTKVFEPLIPLYFPVPPV
jgi:hypothetical protein